LSKTGRNWYASSLYMTPVDAYDTMVLMGLKKQAKEDQKLIFNHLSFNKDYYVSTFETTIRFLGGLLSSYQLSGNKHFLKLATDLGNRLLPVFNSKTGMPYEYVNLKTGKVKGEVNSSAEIGTLLIEFGTLSKLTGNPEYYNKAKKALVTLYNHRSKIGLVGTTINIQTGKWVNTDSHVSGGIDSYYEYLLKSWKLFHDQDCKRMWENTIKSVNKYVADSVKTGLWYGHVNMFTGKRTSTHFGALDAYFPAVLALDGDMQRAKELDTSCFKMWTRYGIEPEQLNYMTMKAVSNAYVLRPENMESAYYLYHYTHNPLYLYRAKVMFDSIVKYCRTPVGFTNLQNVITKKQGDDMESFFLAETLKYAYLIFSPPKTLDFNKIIFNTEAHPIRNTWD
ncbi:MAG TPA: glycoside hydrolase family 47 protein, partial [Balneolales bacterium]|nr:glycoside hydrolase family 47 protein [Balneolales bacterium]